MKKLMYLLTSALVLVISFPTSVKAELVFCRFADRDCISKYFHGKKEIVTQWCGMGICDEIEYLDKKLLRQGISGKLYSFKTTVHEFSLVNDNALSYNGSRGTYIDYVYCSTTKPVYISTNNGYTAYFLNPGGDPVPHSTSTQLPLYMATCHNLIGPNYYSEEMTAKAIELGYPLNLTKYDVTITSPLDIVDQ